MHGVWNILLEGEFLHAYHFGMVMCCHDEIEWRVYPWIFTYSAGYPEKYVFLHPICIAAHCFIRVLLATIHDQGLCPCLCCLVPKSNLDQLGHVIDAKNRIDKACKHHADLVNKAWEFIFELGKPIGGVAVQRLLKNTLMVPTLVCRLSSLTYITTKYILAHHRMLLLNDLVKISICHACSLSIWCMRLSWESGKPSLYTWYEFFMLQLQMDG